LDADDLQDRADQPAASVSINVDVSAAITATIDANGDGKTTAADAKCSYGRAPKRGGILLFDAIGAATLAMAPRRGPLAALARRVTN
jgi:hypothetical protein